MRYWLLLSPASFTVPPGTPWPSISIGGQPLWWVEMVLTPICSRHSSRSVSGRSRMRSSPSNRTFPFVKAEKVVRKRMVVPALPTKISSVGAVSFPPFPQTIKVLGASSTWMPNRFKACIMNLVSSLTSGFSSRLTPSAKAAINKARLV